MKQAWETWTGLCICERMCLTVGNMTKDKASNGFQNCQECVLCCSSTKQSEWNSVIRYSWYWIIIIIIIIILFFNFQNKMKFCKTLGQKLLTFGANFLATLVIGWATSDSENRECYISYLTIPISASNSSSPISWLEWNDNQQARL